MFDNPSVGFVAVWPGPVLNAWAGALETICYDEMPCPGLMQREELHSASTWYDGMLYWKIKLKACPFLKGEEGEIDWG